MLELKISNFDNQENVYLELLVTELMPQKNMATATMHKQIIPPIPFPYRLLNAW